MVPKVKFDYDKEVWVSKKYYLPSYDGDYVLLTPVDLLVGDDTWINKSDLYNHVQDIAASIDDDALRFKDYL